MPAGLSRFAKRGTGCRSLWLLFLVLFVRQLSFAADSICVVCRNEIRFTIYKWSDKVTRTKVSLCNDCTELPDNCYLCSVPTLKNFTRLPDGRVICKRDLSSVIIDDQQAARICEQTKADLDRQFIRFLTIPDTNVTVQLMDRIRLQELYKVIGNDYVCPNTLGCTETKTNDGQRGFEISILSGLPREEVITTCVHEYAHTWIIENVPPDRARTIGKDAVEGFCELLSFLFAEQHGLATAKSNILANHYTRGQIHLFIEAYRQYGLADVVDWMTSGEDPLLRREDLSRVRRLEDRPKLAIEKRPPMPVKASPAVTNSPPILPTRFVLQGVVWSKTQPMATINGRNFDLNQQCVLPLFTGPVAVRCLEIRTNSVLIHIEATGEKQELFLTTN